MAYLITDECISCGACEPECLNQAISEGETIYVIDFNRCTECVGAYGSPRCADACPADACEPDPKLSESRERLLQKWRSLHSGE